MMWALLGVILVGLMGITVDFTRAQMLRAQLQNAADGAALAAARGDTQTSEQRQEAARAFFDAEMGSWAQSASFTLTEMPDNEMRVSVTLAMPLTMGRLVRDEDWTLRVESDAERSGVNIEVGLVLDVTGSMSGQRLTDLKAAAAELVDTIVRVDQTPYYSKIAMVTYSTGVNVGPYAAQARGPITGTFSLDNASWRSATNGGDRTISAASKTNPVTITASNHGYSNGDTVYIWQASSIGMTQIRNRVFTVANAATNTFQLQGVNGTSYNTYNANSGRVARCANETCSVVVTANGHTYQPNDRVYFTGVGGMTQLNSNLFTVSDTDGDTFTLSGTHGSYSSFTSGGNVYCTERGCEYYAFTNISGNTLVRPITTCASERTGSERYTDVAPSASYVGRSYANSGTRCPDGVIVPLTIDADLLTTRINAMQASGYTAGHIGLAWGWYLVSPNFGYLFPEASRPASYGAAETLKIVVLMTDGAFNAAFCNDVIARNSSVGGSERINCDATNGSAYSQAESLCTAMKNRGVVVYTVGFQLGSDTATQNLMTNCATTPQHAYLSSSGDDLLAAFRAIAASITQLRITR